MSNENKYEVDSPSSDYLRLKLGELTPDEVRIARAGFRLGWAQAAKVFKPSEDKNAPAMD